jgi:hypothetical protein
VSGFDTLTDDANIWSRATALSTMTARLPISKTAQSGTESADGFGSESVSNRKEPNQTEVIKRMLRSA